MAKLLEEDDPEIGPEKRKRSLGEVVFDRGVYTGVGLGVNEASSLWITDQFMFGKNLFKSVPGLKTIGSWFSEEGFRRASEFIAKTFKLTEKIAKDGTKILPHERGGNTLLMVTLLSGGTLLILPMKWLEDNKTKLVEKTNHIIDKLRGSNLTPEQVAERDAEVKKSIACSPRQSWGSMMVGRLVAISSSVSSGTLLMGKERNDRLMNWSEKFFTGSNQPPAKRNAFHRYARLLSVETYSCTISSVVLELMSKITARYYAKPHDPEICEAMSAPLPAKPAASDDTDKKDADCGCNKDKTKDFHAAKIQSRKTLAASNMQAVQI